MIFGKLSSLPARLRRTPADHAGRALQLTHVSTSREARPSESQSQNLKLRRESCSATVGPPYALVKPRHGVSLSALEGVARRLAQARSIPEIIAQLDNPALADALHALPRITLSAASGQADVEQFQAICERLQRRCPNLTHLEVADAILSVPAARALAQLAHLSVLFLNHHAVAQRRRQPCPMTCWSI